MLMLFTGLGVGLGVGAEVVIGAKTLFGYVIDKRNMKMMIYIENTRQRSRRWRWPKTRKFYQNRIK